MRSALTGKHIVNTRATHQAAALDTLLRERGAIPIAYPCIEIGLPDDVDAFYKSIQSALDGNFDWLILTSSNTVYALEVGLETLGHAPHVLADIEGLHLAAIGTSTLEAAQNSLGLNADIVPEEFVAEALVEAFAEAVDLQGQRIWLPQSAIAKPTLARLLGELGVALSVVSAYQNTTVQGDHPIRPHLSEIDAITFTSGSTVRNFLKRLEVEGSSLDDVEHIAVACIGPKAAKTAMEWAFDVRIVAEEHTLAGMVSALEAYFADQD